MKKYDLEDNYIIWVVDMPWNTSELQDFKILKRYNKLCDQFRYFILKYQKAQNVFLPFFDGIDIEMMIDIVRETDINY